MFTSSPQPKKKRCRRGSFRIQSVFIYRSESGRGDWHRPRVSGCGMSKENMHWSPTETCNKEGRTPAWAVVDDRGVDIQRIVTTLTIGG